MCIFLSLYFKHNWNHPSSTAWGLDETSWFHLLISEMFQPYRFFGSSELQNSKQQGIREDRLWLSQIAAQICDMALVSGCEKLGPCLADLMELGELLHCLFYWCSSFFELVTKWIASKGRVTVRRKILYLFSHIGNFKVEKIPLGCFSFNFPQLLVVRNSCGWKPEGPPLAG